MKARLKALILLGLGLTTAMPVMLSCRPTELPTDLPVCTVKQQLFSRKVDAEGTLRAVRTTPISVPADAEWVMRVTWLAPDGSIVKKGEPLVHFDDLDIKERLSDAESDLAISTATKHKDEVLLQAAKQDRLRAALAAKRDLDLSRTFQRKDSTIFSRDQIIEDEIDGRLKEVQAECEQKIERVDSRLSSWKLGLLDVDVVKAAEEIHRTQKGLRALDLTAPHDGVFVLRPNRGDPLTVGDSVRRSQILADVAVVDKMEAEVFVLEAEAAGLAEGRTAEVTLESQPGRVFAGRVKQVEKIAKSRIGKDPTQYFGVIVSLDKTFPEVMKPGQRVWARLMLHEAKALVVPRPALFDRGGHWVVYRKAPQGDFAAVNVVLGPSTAGLVVVESGLSEGDVLALRDPGKPAGELLSSPAGKSASAR